MRQVIGIVALTVLCGACGDDGGADREPDGFYGVETPDGCAVTFSFEPKLGTYEESIQCELESGAIGADADGGRYRVEGNRIYFTPTKTTCESNDLEPFDLRFEVYDNGDLLVSNDDVTVEYVKLDDRDSAGARGTAIILGCWNEDDTFTAR